VPSGGCRTESGLLSNQRLVYTVHRIGLTCEDTKLKKETHTECVTMMLTAGSKMEMTGEWGRPRIGQRDLFLSQILVR